MSRHLVCDLRQENRHFFVVSSRSARYVAVLWIEEGNLASDGTGNAYHFPADERLILRASAR